MRTTRARSSVRSFVAERVQKHRRALRAAGLRPIQIWVPDVRSKSFAARARKQALAIARSAHEQDDLAFKDEYSLMVDKITTVAKGRLGKRIGRLDDEDIVRLDRAIIVFLGLAATGVPD